MRVRKALGAACAIAAVFVAIACSSSSSRPPVENCSGAGCASSGGGGSGSSGSGGGTDGALEDAANCGVSSNDAQCSLCLAQRCCTQLQGCTTDMACGNLYVCVNRCGGGSTCVNTCEQAYPAGSSLYEALTTCSQVCAVCTESGTGDPCGGLSSYPCASNLTCTGQWCSRTCTQDSDCNGLGQNGGNFLGNPNACIRGAGSIQECAPGCMGPGDCATFSGTICRTATDASGSMVSVCGSVSDAAAD